MRGVVQQKKEDDGRLLSVPRMDQEQIKDFAVALGLSSVGLVRDERGNRNAGRRMAGPLD